MLDVGLIWDARPRCSAPACSSPIAWPGSRAAAAGRSRRLRQRSPSTDVKIAAGEEECTVAGFARLMDFGRIDVVRST
jgi:hypothetical protein